MVCPPIFPIVFGLWTCSSCKSFTNHVVLAGSVNYFKINLQSDAIVRKAGIYRANVSKFWPKNLQFFAKTARIMWFKEELWIMSKFSLSRKRTHAHAHAHLHQVIYHSLHSAQRFTPSQKISSNGQANLEIFRFENSSDVIG